MWLVKWLKALTSPTDVNGFKKVVKDHWYSGSWYMYGTKTGLPDEEGKIALNYRQLDLFSVDGLAPACVIGDKVGLYKVTSTPYYGSWNKGSDPADWDDGASIDLKLVKVVSLDYAKSQLPSLMPPLQPACSNPYIS